MILSNHVNPEVGQLKELEQNLAQDQPIVMVNILKFKKDEISEGLTGPELYKRYAQNVIPLLENAGGSVIWRGKVLQTIIGDTEKTPELFMLVRYPSVKNFLDMIYSQEYREVSKDRSLALVYGGLYATSEI